MHFSHATAQEITFAYNDSKRDTASFDISHNAELRKQIIIILEKIGCMCQENMLKEEAKGEKY